MRKLFLNVYVLLLATLVTVACGERTADNSGKKSTELAASVKAKSGSKSSQKKKKKKKALLTPTSAGSPYEILIVAEPSEFLNGCVDSLYNVLTDDLEGVSQSEPSFRVSKINTPNFSKMLRMCRNIITINVDGSTYTQCKFKVSRDVYAFPQIVMNIQAPDARKFKKFIIDNQDMLRDYFTRAEINREADLLEQNHNIFVQQKVKEMFGSDIWVPAELSKTKVGRNFLWASTNRVEKDMNFVIYSYPYRDSRTFTDKYFIRKRDSVLGANIPGPRDGQHMETTQPFVEFSEETVHGSYAQIARGLWDISNYDMGGPFVSMARVDEKNQRVVVVEGFVYNPNKPKRDLIRRLEAALYTLRLPDELDLEKYVFDLDEITIAPEN